MKNLKNFIKFFRTKRGLIENAKNPPHFVRAVASVRLRRTAEASWWVRDGSSLKLKQRHRASATSTRFCLPPSPATPPPSDLPRHPPFPPTTTAPSEPGFLFAWRRSEQICVPSYRRSRTLWAPDLGVPPVLPPWRTAPMAQGPPPFCLCFPS